MRISRRKFLGMVAGLVAAAGTALYLERNVLFPSSNVGGSTTNVSVTDFVEGVEVPWSLAFAPDGRLFFTERVGRIRIVENGNLLSASFAEPQVSAVGEGGLLGLTLDPNFQQNHYVYTYYTYQDNSGNLLNRLVRHTDSSGTGTNPQVLIDGIPGGDLHDGGRIKFGPDGKLYITTGETFQRNLAQDLTSLAGKILRANADGSVPANNPFPNSLIYSYGNRNPQGLDWHPITGKLYESEHGPTGEMGYYAHDEINIIEPGKNYGWPIIVGKGNDPRYVDPIIDTGNETLAPSGITFYRGTLFKQWRNSLFVACLRGMHLHRIVFDSTGTGVAFDEKLFQNTYGRLRDVVNGPEGALYISTSNRDGRGSPIQTDDRILKVVLSQ